MDAVVYQIFLVVLLLLTLAFCVVTTCVMVWQLRNALRRMEKRLDSLAPSAARLSSRLGAMKIPEKEKAAHATPPPLPQSVVSTTPLPVQSSPEGRFAAGLRSTWNWIVCGEEFRRKDVPFEYALATTWLVRLAVVAILCGVGFFLKYSIEHGLMSPPVRVAVAAGGGIAALLLGLRLARKEYRLIGMGLIGGGFATLYGAVFAAFQLYHLLEQGWAFALMALISLCAGTVAVRQNSMLTALLGILGAYATPVMLSTGVKNLPGLFGYVLIVGLVTAFVSGYRSWKLLPGVSLLCTYGLMSLGLLDYEHDKDFVLSLSFATAYFLLFSGLRLAGSRRGEALSWPSMAGMLTNLACYMSFALWLIDSVADPRHGAAATVGLTLFYLLWSNVETRRGAPDKKLMVTLYGLAAFSLTMTLYLLLNTSWLAAAWSVQALILLWIGCRADFTAARVMGYAVFAVSLLRLLIFDLDNHVFCYFSSYGAGFLSRFSTLGMLTVTVAAAYVLLKESLRGGKLRDVLNCEVSLRKFSGGLAYVMLLIYLSLETNALMRFYLPVFRGGGVSALWAVFALLSLSSGIIKDMKGLRYAGLALFLATALKVPLVDMDRLSQVARVAAFIVTGLAMLGGAFAYIRFKDGTEAKKGDGK